MKVILSSFVFIVIILISACTPSNVLTNIAQDTQETTKSGETIMITNGVKHIVPLDEVLQGCLGGKDCIPSIDNPKFETLKQADSWLKSNDIIFGMDLNGEQRAYPQRILNWHEIVNDEIQDKPIAITFCPLCGSGVSFERIINNQVVEFGVSGKLWNSDLVMYDRLTETYWNQISGKAIVGELVGQELTQVPIHTTTWEEWKELFPNTKVLSKNTGFIRDYDRYPYGDYEYAEDLLFPVKNQDFRLHPKAVVYGLEIDGEAKAYPLSLLAGTITDEFTGITFEITNNKGMITFIDKNSGKEYFPVRNFWFAWFAHYPKTELYQD